MRFPILFACAAALLLISVGASHAAAPAITGEMQKKYESQRLVHQESGSEETRQGTLAFQKPLRVRWETKAPHAELLVITDKDVWDYLPDEELAYQYSPEVVHDSRSIIQVITGQRISPSRPSRTTTDWPCSGSTPKILLRSLWRRSSGWTRARS